MRVLKRPDIVQMPWYYTRSPASGIWILELGTVFVGLIAVDASKNSLSDESVMDKEPKKEAKGTASTATIRHFYVLEQYRKTIIQDDLLSFALKRVFEASPNVQSIRITPSPLYRYLDEALKRQGFVEVEKGRTVGLFRWTALTYEQSRETYKSRNS